MAWIILDTSSYISGQPFFAGPDPIDVSESDAKVLISMRYARPADPPPPTSKPTKKPSNPPVSEP